MGTIGMMQVPRRKVVLIAEAADGDLWGAVLIANGYEVEHTTSPPTGLLLAAEKAPIAIVCDGDLPALRGDMFAKLLKANRFMAVIPLVLVTDNDEVAAHAHGRLRRGFEPGELVELLRRLAVTPWRPA